jgi:hypothetical protein
VRPVHDGTVPRRARMPGWAMLASALLTATVVNAIVIGGLPGTVTPAVVSPLPVALSAGTGTTVTTGTVASTTTLVPGLGAVSAVSLSRSGSQDWDVRLAVTSVSGFGVGETLVLALGAQAISLSSLTTSPPYVTSAVTLAGTPVTITVATLSAITGCHGCSVTAEIRLDPAGAATLPSITYPYTILTP